MGEYLKYPRKDINLFYPWKISKISRLSMENKKYPILSIGLYGRYPIRSKERYLDILDI